MAVEMVKEGLITRDEAILRVDPSSIDQLLHPALDPQAQKTLLARGLPASPGAASGQVVFSAEEAERRAGQGKAVILVRVETSPEDVARHEGGARRPHRARRHDEPRRGRRARHGQVLRRRLLRDQRGLPRASDDDHRLRRRGAHRRTRCALKAGDVITLDGGDAAASTWAPCRRRPPRSRASSASS